MSLCPEGKEPATLPGFKEVESFAKEKGLNPEVLMEWCRNLSGKAKLGEWNRKFPKESKGWKDRIEQELKFIENTRELANFSSPPYPMVGRSVVTPFLIKAEFLSPKPSFFISSPTGLGPPSCPTVFRKPSLAPLHSGDDRIYIRLNADKVFVRLVLDNFHMAKYNSLLFREPCTRMRRPRDS